MSKSDFDYFIEELAKNVISPGDTIEKLLSNWESDYDYDDEYYKKHDMFKEKEKECECGLDAIGGGGKHAHYCPKYKEEE